MRRSVPQRAWFESGNLLRWSRCGKAEASAFPALDRLQPMDISAILQPEWLHSGAMASLTLKNLPDDLLDALRDAAERDRRSLTQEAIHLLECALHDRAEGPRSHDAEAQLAAWRALAGQWESDLDAEAEAQQIMDSRTGGREVDL